MGCVHGKCCSRYPSSSSSSGDLPASDPYTFQRKQTLLTERSLESVSVPSHGFKLEYSALTQRGYYPDSLDKENQDCYTIKTSLQGNPSAHFFGVFDGHGQFGTQCSNFARETVVKLLAEDRNLLDDPIKAYESAFSISNAELHQNLEIDDSMSGTTAITVLLVGKTLYVANVGDSRAVIAVRGSDGVVTAENLSNDQTPFRRDEYERVKLCGARVLSVDQVEGVKDPDIQSWGDEESDGNDPPRLWVPNGMYPGTAFTRSVGDSTAERIGVVADPEVAVVELSPEHLFFVVASDGVFEFLSSQAVVDMAAKYADPRDACAAIAGESYKLWLEHESRTDDITIIIVHLKGLNLGAGDTSGSSRIVRNGKESSEVSSVSTGSEVYRSVRSDNSELQTSQFHISTNRSPAIVVPSPTSPTPLEV